MNKLIGMKSISLLTVSALIIVQSCSLFEESNQEKPLARAFEQYLYPSDLQKVIPSGTSQEDSAEMANRYIESWVQEQLMQHRAEEALTEEQMDFKSQIEEYYRSLVIFTYRQKLLEQKLDTVVTEDEIQAYYDENSKNFLLDDNVIKGTFIKVPLTAPNLEQLRRWSWNNREQDLEEIEKYCITYAEKFSDFNDTWVGFSSIKAQLPMRISDPTRYLNSYHNIETTDSLYRYLVHISDHLSEGEESPVEMVSKDITNIILNKRKIEFIRDLEHRVYTEGVSRNQFEIYR